MQDAKVPPTCTVIQGEYHLSDSCGNAHCVLKLTQRRTVTVFGNVAGSLVSIEKKLLCNTTTGLAGNERRNNFVVATRPGFWEATKSREIDRKPLSLFFAPSMNCGQLDSQYRKQSELVLANWHETTEDEQAGR